MRRAWRAIELRHGPEAGRAGFAPAAQVAQAVGALVVEAATHDLRGAAVGAEEGCARKLAGVVDTALARLVGNSVGDPAPDDRSPSGVRHAADLAVTRLPAPGWWARESTWSPRIVGAPPPSTVWPALPESPLRTEARPRPAARTVVAEDPLSELAERLILDDVRPATPGRMGGAR